MNFSDLLSQTDFAQISSVIFCSFTCLWMGRGLGAFGGGTVAQSAYAGFLSIRLLEGIKLQAPTHSLITHRSNFIRKHVDRNGFSNKYLTCTFLYRTAFRNGLTIPESTRPDLAVPVKRIHKKGGKPTQGKGFSNRCGDVPCTAISRTWA